MSIALQLVWIGREIFERQRRQLWLGRRGRSAGTLVVGQRRHEVLDDSIWRLLFFYLVFVFTLILF